MHGLMRGSWGGPLGRYAWELSEPVLYSTPRTGLHRLEEPATFILSGKKTPSFAIPTLVIQLFSKNGGEER
jgi:hypothetical protein